MSLRARGPVQNSGIAHKDQGQRRGAGDRDRTGDIQLGKLFARVAWVCSFCETIEKSSPCEQLRKQSKLVQSLQTVDFGPVLWMFLWMIFRGAIPIRNRIMLTVGCGWENKKGVTVNSEYKANMLLKHHFTTHEWMLPAPLVIGCSVLRCFGAAC